MRYIKNLINFPTLGWGERFHKNVTCALIKMFTKNVVPKVVFSFYSAVLDGFLVRIHNTAHVTAIHVGAAG